MSELEEMRTSTQIQSLEAQVNQLKKQLEEKDKILAKVLATLKEQSETL